MTDTLYERAWKAADVTVWSMERLVIACQTRLSATEGMVARGTADPEQLESHAKSLARTQVDLDDLREVIDEFNVPLQESGLSAQAYDKRQRELSRKIIGYNKTYRPS